MVFMDNWYLNTNFVKYCFIGQKPFFFLLFFVKNNKRSTNVISAYERFKQRRTLLFFLLESFKRAITRQSAFERFKTQIFFCSAKIKDRWLPVPLLLPLPLPPQNSKQHGSTVNTAASGCGGNCRPGGIRSWLGLPKGVPLSPNLSFPLLSSPLLSSPLLSSPLLSASPP